jgi:hypothetical protein
LVAASTTGAITAAVIGDTGTMVITATTMGMVGMGTTADMDTTADTEVIDRRTLRQLHTLCGTFPDHTVSGLWHTRTGAAHAIVGSHATQCGPAGAPAPSTRGHPLPKVNVHILKPGRIPGVAARNGLRPSYGLAHNCRSTDTRPTSRNTWTSLTLVARAPGNRTEASDFGVMLSPENSHCEVHTPPNAPFNRGAAAV